MSKAIRRMLLTPYNYDEVAHSEQFGTNCEAMQNDEIKVVHDHTTDINIIAAQAKLTGTMPWNSMAPLTDVDFSDVEDYADGLRKIEAAKDAFMKLPPEFRAMFDNDAGKAQAELAGMSPAQIEALFNERKDEDKPITTRTDAAASTGNGNSGTTKGKSSDADKKQTEGS